MDENREIHTDDKEKAELLNNFFKSVFTNEDSTQGIPPFPSELSTTWKLKIVKIYKNTLKN